MADLGLIREPTHYRLVPGAGAVLDVGCGQNKWPGAIGLDISPDTAADVVADLNEFPYPLEDGRFDQILCQDVIEHVREPLRFLSELHRVAKPARASTSARRISRRCWPTATRRTSTSSPRSPSARSSTRSSPTT